MPVRVRKSMVFESPAMTDKIDQNKERADGAEALRCLVNRTNSAHCKAVLFDFGGTLDSDGEHWLDRFYELYEKVDIELPHERIKQVFYQVDAQCCADPQVNQMGLRSLMQHHVQLQFSAHGLHDRAKEKRMADAFCTQTELALDRNQRLLARLCRRYRMAVVSNFYGNVEMLCEEAGLTQYLTAVLDSTQVGVAKPDPAIFRKALKQVNAIPEECIFVGDSYERDMLPALRLGMRTIWLKGPKPRLPAEPAPVDHTIASLAELEALLL